MYDIVGSIVLFKNESSVVKKAIESFLATSLKIHLYIIDNSPTDCLKDVLVFLSRISMIILLSSFHGPLLEWQLRQFIELLRMPTAGG